MKKHSKPIQSTETSFTLLERIKEAGSISVSELADAVDRPKSTVYRHLSTLVTLGYILKEDNQYRLSLQFLDFGDKARAQYPLYSVIKPEVDELVEDTGEREQVMVSEGDDDGTVIGALSFAAPKTSLHGELYRETIPERVSDIATVLGVRVTYE
jgi:DNA-binding IclR family transcriptional regulator